MLIKIQIINGPNLNLLGKREPEIYGKMTLEDINIKIKDFCDKKKISVDFFQSNIEGEIVNEIQKLNDQKGRGLIINAAAFTHTSVAILDALSILKIPKIEIHLSNIYKREEFRQKSLISKSVDGIICGFGFESYIYAVDAIDKMIKNGN
ncbi:MAG: type II 3-dehydroquinate dehydratase [Candidatus Pelagibacter sp.]|nr:type II 3-dehydroquinate dehydratase [Candidatus Pelagibacter sp.]OUV98264.1 MAG: type II 3-dehydroquinate dehydratase [Candidatus Pelagibacter sp. TMED142]|tara:strand:+ start:350 stop:799 length:450 start_codon:yes stop_codon:yes gene_type:complete